MAKTQSAGGGKPPKFPIDKLRGMAMDDGGKLLNRELLAHNIRTYIIQRTLLGRKHKQGKFKPYSEKYAEYKKKTKGTDTPNLFDTGQLLASLKVIEVGEYGGVGSDIKWGAGNSKLRMRVIADDSVPRKDKKGNITSLENSALLEFHRTGTDKVVGSMPARTFTFIDKLELGAIVKKTMEGITFSDNFQLG